MPDHKDSVLIITVGTGRSRADIAEAIVYSVNQHSPAFVVFLCSKKTEQETLPLVLEKLGWDEGRYRVEVCGDEEDVQRLFIEWNQRWPEWVAGRDDHRVVVDFTSGTKAMSAAAVLLAVARGASTLSYVTGPRDETGRVQRSEGTKTISPHLITAHRQLRVAVEHFHAGSYAAARDIAGDYLRIAALPHDGLREVARSLHFTSAAYEAWDRFDYATAGKHLRESARYWPSWTWVETSEQLAANQELIRQAQLCTRGAEALGTPLCADLLANCRRCFRREAWDDAVARLYRACEMVAQLKLWRDHQVKTGDLDPSKLSPHVCAGYADRRNAAPGGKLKLGLGESYELLEKLDDPVGREYVARGGGFTKKGELQSLLQVRNESLLAHGVVPIRREKAEGLREHVLALARIVDPTGFDPWLAKAEPIRFKAF